MRLETLKERFKRLATKKRMSMVGVVEEADDANNAEKLKKKLQRSEIKRKQLKLVLISFYRMNSN